MSCSNCTSRFLQPFVANVIRSLRRQRQEVYLTPLLPTRRNYTSPTRPERNFHTEVDVDPQGDDYFLPYQGVLVKSKTRKLCQKSVAWDTRWTNAPVNPLFDNSWAVESEATTHLPPIFADEPFGRAFEPALKLESNNTAEKQSQLEDGSAPESAYTAEDSLMGEKNPKHRVAPYEAFHHKILRGAEKKPVYVPKRRNRPNTWDLTPPKHKESEKKVKAKPRMEPKIEAETEAKTETETLLEEKEDGKREQDVKKMEDWMIQKNALKKKFGDAGWQPRKRLSPDTLEIIRGLHKTYAECTTEKLAEVFKVSPEAIRRILKSKWVPTAEEHEDRLERWQRRKEIIHQKYVDEGVYKSKEAKRQRQVDKLENAYNKSRSMNLSQRML